MTDAPPVHCPARADLDDLEVLRRGLYGPDARMRPLPVPADVAAAALAAGTLVVTDPEGVPVAHVDEVVSVAHVDEVAPAGAHALTGVPRWLAPMSSRPFQALHLDGPRDLAGALVVEAPSDLPLPLPAGTRLLVLASTSLEESTEGTETVRAAVRAAAEADGAWVGVVPLPPGDTRRRAALLRTLGVQDRPGAHRTSPADRQPPGVVLLLTGLSGSGKSTVARAVATRLVEDGTRVTLLDGDRVRRHLSAGLGFGPADRDTNIRRIGWVAAEVAHHGGIAICSPIAPSDAVRREVAAMAAARGARFVLVHVSTPLPECERRDRKGLYAAARRGEIPDFTGVSAPYDVPEDPDLRLDTTGRSVPECADAVLRLLAAPTQTSDA